VFHVHASLFAWMAESAHFDAGTDHAPLTVLSTPRRFTDLPAWQACYAYKQAVYAACAEGPLSRDWTRRTQLEESVAGPPALLAEGFGHSSPAEFACFTVVARSSLLESQDRLRDAVDKHYMGETKRQELDALAETALKEVTGLMEQLQAGVLV
jgi:four helix bundle protein